MGREIIEKESLRGEASERHLGGIWEAPGRHLGGIWEASERHLGLQAATGLQEAPNHKNRCPSQLKCKSCVKICILHTVCEGQISKYCKLQAKMLTGSRRRSTGATKAPLPTP